MDQVLFTFAGLPVTPDLAMTGAALLVLVVLGLAFLASVGRQRHRSEQIAAAAQAHGAELERSLAELMRAQAEMTGRMQTMAEIFGTGTSDLARVVNDRLDTTSQRVGQALAETRAKTDEGLAKLNERLAVIDRAQTTIRELSGEIVSLQSILSNKQTRGAFGQGRMEAIIADGLAHGGYSFQTSLSNGSRPDALVHMPNGAPPLVIDAKFPLESWQRIASAQSPDEARQASAQFKTDIGVHIKAIAEKYLIVGETQDTAFMFVPSESIFADIHESFDDMVQRAAKARIVIVSPSLLMLSIQVIQALLRDVKMREQAHLIQKEVRELLIDVGRLDDRVSKLASHFAMVQKDVTDITISSSKITRRGDRIEAMELDEPRRLAGE